MPGDHAASPAAAEVGLAQDFAAGEDCVEAVKCEAVGFIRCSRLAVRVVEQQPKCAACNAPLAKPTDEPWIDPRMRDHDVRAVQCLIQIECCEVIRANRDTGYRRAAAALGQVNSIIAPASLARGLIDND